MVTNLQPGTPLKRISRLGNRRAVWMLVACTVLLSSCYKGAFKHSNTTTAVAIAEMQFVAINQADYSRLEGVKIVLIDGKGDVVDVLVTNNEGVAKKVIAVPSDQKYDGITSIPLQGTVAAIAFKPGYSVTVVFEVPISETATGQPVEMVPRGPEMREDYTHVQLGNNHHLIVGLLVEKYAKYLR